MSRHILRRLAVLGLCAAACLSTPAQTIACYGDSLTAGYRAPAGQAYPDDLQADLAALGYSVHVANRGVVNLGAAQAVQQLPSVLPHLLQEHPDVVLLEFGGVDALHHVPVPEIEHNLAALLGPLVSAHIHVVLLAVALPAPRVGSQYSRAFAAMYASLAARYRVPLVPSLLAHVEDHPSRMSDDGIHPNAEGYRQVARNVLPVVRPLITRP